MDGIVPRDDHGGVEEARSEGHGRRLHHAPGPSVQQPDGVSECGQDQDRQSTTQVIPAVHVRCPVRDGVPPVRLEPVPEGEERAGRHRGQLR